jgi:hypothetical protein
MAITKLAKKKKPICPFKLCICPANRAINTLPKKKKKKKKRKKKPLLERGA